MPTLGFLGAVLVALALALWATRAAPRSARLALPALFVALVFLPLGGILFGGYFVAVVGEPSATSLVLLAVACVALAGGPSVRGADLAWISGAVAAGAVALYPFALGLSAYDPYELGYGPRGLLVALALLSLVAGLAGRWLVLLCLASAMVLHRLDAGESRNLWDYLLDPWVSLYAGARLLQFTIFARSSKSR
jgi:hypothetical protein